MGHLLLWVVSLVAALLAVATALALRGRRLRLLVAGLVTLLPALVAALLTWAAFELRSHNVTRDWVGYVLSWDLAYVVGVAWLHIRARGRRRAGAEPWPIGQLATQLLGTLILLFVIFVALDASVDRMVAAEIASARAEALPLRPGAVPNEHDAALAYDKAFELAGFGSESMLPEELSGASKPGFDAGTSAVTRFLDGKGPALSQLRRAASLRRFGAGSFVRYSNYRRAAMALALHARRAAASGNTRQAEQDMVAIWRTADHLSWAQTWFLPFAAGIRGIGVAALEDVLASSSGAGSWDVAASILAAPTSGRQALRRALQVEESRTIQWFRHPLPSSPHASLLEGLRRGPYGRLFNVFLILDDLASYRKWMDELQWLCADPYHERAEEIQRFSADFAKAPVGLFTREVTHGIRPLVTVTVADARWRLSRLAVATTSFHARTGRYPRQLGELVPEDLPVIPIDPFSGDPLRSAPIDGGLVLYSVGFNGTDDGGVEEGDDRNQGDVIFCLGGAHASRRLGAGGE